jgi:hypothetical protein
MKKFTLIFCLIAALFTTGCAAFNPFSLASPIVTGVVMWKDGEAVKYYNEETDPMHRSVKAALKDLNLPVSKDEAVKDGYYIVAGDKDRFKIHILTVRPHITKVSIRVNFMGDKPYAELVYKTTDTFVDTIDFNNGRPVKGERFKLFRRDN